MELYDQFKIELKSEKRIVCIVSLLDISAVLFRYPFKRLKGVQVENCLAQLNPRDHFYQLECCHRSDKS